MSKPLHSLVVPVYNEEEGLEALYSRLVKVADDLESRFGINIELVMVNDGSKDRSPAILNEFCGRDARFKALHFSRNFGHQVAISAGLEWARGETVTVMDADLQDPPELLNEFFEKWKAGYEVVYAVRRTRAGETAFKLWTAKLFYRLMKKLIIFDFPIDTGDFRLMDRKAVDALLKLPERHRFVRGLVSWVGFRQIGVEYDRDKRAFGQTHYPLKKMLKFALDGVTAFSIVPLQIASYLGVLSAACAFLGIAYTLYLRFFTDKTIQGWSSIMIVVLFIGGAQLMALGVLGEYLGRTFDEVRRRPLYLLRETRGFGK